jgi:hypothetical protein
MVTICSTTLQFFRWGYVFHVVSKLTNIFLHSISQVAFVMERHFVICQVASELLGIVSIIYNIKGLVSN